MEALYILVGLIVGGGLTFIIVKLLFKNGEGVSSDEVKALDEKIEILEKDNIILNEKVRDIEVLKSELDEKEKEILRLTGLIAIRETELKNLNQKMAENKEEVLNIQEKFQLEFKNLANEILEEKSRKFTEQNKTNIGEILKPLDEKIKGFEQKVEETYEKGLRDRTALQTELRKLHELNAKISEEANNLTKALKGDVKKQGNWGEIVLERILENSGLIKNQEYKTQFSTENDDGKRIQPDVVVFLPDEKHIIIDSKVSLVAYESLVNTDDEILRVKFAKDHILSVRNHIKQLSEKKYQTSEALNSPEYVLLFIPIESSFSVAVQEDQELFNFAWDNKIVIVSPSTLIATLMTISSIWKQENQTKHAIEIATQSGLLYDKFVGFVDELEKIGKSIKNSENAYDEAMKKLKTGKGNLMGRTEKIKQLGAKASKSLSKDMLEGSQDGE